MGRWLSGGLLVTVLLSAGCAGDPAIARWSHEWLTHERSGSPEALAAVAERAPTRADRDMARFGQARALRVRGQSTAAFSLFDSIGDTAMRRIDRARARYEIARMAKSAARHEEAVRLFRQVVETYPQQPSAMRSMQHLTHLMEAGGVPAQRDALRWTGALYSAMATTPVGDDLAFMAAEIVYGWWRVVGGERLGAQAETMLRRVTDGHRGSGHWDDALWMLSRLYHAQGRYEDEIIAIGRILATRETPLIVGHYDTTFHWVGMLRIARLQMLTFNDPARAAATYAGFVSSFTYSRWRDDARFWQGCALLRAGQPQAAEAAFATISEVYPESKYLRRLDAARAQPHGDVCTPMDFEEGSW